LPDGGSHPHPKNPSAGDYEHDYESFLAVQKKNKRKLAEVEGSMKKLLPLLERIRQTDELIDATVYRLYGLTEEEIGIVEGATRP
jgi:hypothetical protein